MKTDETVVDGGFLKESLNRNNTQIKRDRAEVIEEDLEMEFSRGVQNAAKELKRTKRDLRNMYDFSPTTSQSLVLASDLDAELINRKDTEWEPNLHPDDLYKLIGSSKELAIKKVKNY